MPVYTGGSNGPQWLPSRRGWYGTYIVVTSAVWVCAISTLAQVAPTCKSSRRCHQAYMLDVNGERLIGPSALVFGVSALSIVYYSLALYCDSAHKNLIPLYTDAICLVLIFAANVACMAWGGPKAIGYGDESAYPSTIWAFGAAIILLFAFTVVMVVAMWVYMYRATRPAFAQLGRRAWRHSYGYLYNFDRAAAGELERVPETEMLRRDDEWK